MRLSTVLLFVLLLFPTVFAAPVRGAQGGFDPRPLLEQAQELLETGRALEAVETYRSVYVAAPDTRTRSFALVRLADVMALYLDQKRQAAGLYEQALREHPSSPYLENAYFNGAMLQYELGNLDRSAELFRNFGKAYPSNGRARTARFMVGRIQREKEDLEKGTTRREPATPKYISRGREPVVRVLLERRNSFSCVFSSGYVLKYSNGSTRAGKPGTVRLARRGGHVLVDGVPVRGRVVLTPKKSGFRLGKRNYAGALAVEVSGKKLMAVNRVGLETYLYGVVPMEMPRDFEPQALQAQAVAARSYALAMLVGASQRAYDVTDGEGSQVYGGAGQGNMMTRMAVESTRGMVLSHDKRPLPAFYHSHSGGRLEDDAQVWSSDLPVYSVRRDKPSLVAKPMRWEHVIHGEELAARLRAKGFDVRRVVAVEPERTSPSGRLVTVRVRTEKGEFSLRASTLRLIIGGHDMKSTLCRFSREGESLVIKGQGFGHGVGMSQWGAQAMAEHGRSFRSILAFYYPGAGLENWY